MYALENYNRTAVLLQWVNAPTLIAAQSRLAIANRCIPQLLRQSQHGSFGGPGLIEDEYYAAGSDDFRGYVWKIPPVAALTEERRVIAAREWNSFYDFISKSPTFSPCSR